jgi:hypothetical protein
MYCHSLSWVVVGSKFVVNKVDEGIDSRDSLELNASQDRPFEGLWESFFDLLRACEL